MRGWRRAWSLPLHKDRRTRAEEERLAGRLLLNIAAEACGVPQRLILDLLEGAGLTWRYYAAKAGSIWNLIRWLSPRAVKETFVSPSDYRYPFMDAGD